MHRAIEQHPDPLEGASFTSSGRRPAPFQTLAHTNKHITLDYRAHREIFRAIVDNSESGLHAAWVQNPGMPIRAEEAIAMCVELNQADLIPVILDLGGKPDKLRSSCLATLMTWRRFDVLKLLVEAGAPVNNEAGESEALNNALGDFNLYVDAKQLATRYKTLDAEFFCEPKGSFDFSEIEFLLKSGARIDTTAPMVQRHSVSPTSGPVDWIESHYSTLLSLFEKHGAQLGAERDFGASATSGNKVEAIEQAIEQDDISTLRELLSKDSRMLSLIRNPLSKAVLSGTSVELLRCLIDHKCDVNEELGKPLLYACTAERHIKYFPTPLLVRTLLKFGADVSLRGAEAFIQSFERFPESLGFVFLETGSVPSVAAHLDVALQGLLNKSRFVPELEFVRSQKYDEPAFRHLNMAKSLVDRGADPYSAILLLLKKSSLAPYNDHTSLELKTASSHYTVWRDFLRERLSEKLSTDRTELDNCYKAAAGSLYRYCSLMQLGNNATQRYSLPGMAIRYTHLMAQVLEPSNSCWMNSLIREKQRQIPDFMISP